MQPLFESRICYRIRFLIRLPENMVARNRGLAALWLHMVFAFRYDMWHSDEYLVDILSGDPIVGICDVIVVHIAWLNIGLQESVIAPIAVITFGGHMVKMCHLIERVRIGNVTFVG